MAAGAGAGAAAAAGGAAGAAAGGVCAKAGIANAVASAAAVSNDKVRFILFQISFFRVSGPADTAARVLNPE